MDKENISVLSLGSVIRNLQKEQYVRAMKETNYGWEASKSERFNHVGCPDDLFFVSSHDLPHPTECRCECEDCWHYVLKNKWG